MTVVVVLIIAVTVILIVVLLLRIQRGHNSTRIQRLCVIIFSLKFCDNFTTLLYRDQMSALDITAKSNEAYELTKISEEPTYM